MGWNNFNEFKLGAHSADRHFLNTPWRDNIPVLMALFNLWNTNALGINNLGIFTYDYKIRSLTKYLSQMLMESNGKSYNSKEELTSFYTCPLVWGGYGPDSQHSNFQWLLQGSDYTACDFIGIKEKTGLSTSSYNMLLAQVTALSLGEANNEEKYKSVEGNNPISLFRLKNLNPKRLGYLLACYENKVFVESKIYDINSFDQWGVQLGKKLTLQANEKQEYMSKFFNKKFL